MIKILIFFNNHPIVNDQRFRTLARFLRWQFKSRFFRRDHIHNWISGAKFFVKNGEAGLTGNIYTGLHEFKDMGFLLHLLHSDDLFIDIGANSGSYTILASAVVGAKTIAIEPVGKTFKRLENNCKLNSLESLVEAKNIGLSSKPGKMLITSNSDTENHIALEEISNPTESVQVTTLDELVQDRLPLVLKIDVEGWELPVLRGGKKVLSSTNLLAVIVEVNGSGKKYGFDDEQIVNELQKYGFQEFNYDPLTRTLSKSQVYPIGKGNVIFIRDLKKAMSRITAAPKREILGKSI